MASYKELPYLTYGERSCMSNNIMKTVYAYFCLDILHVGHLRYMQKAKALAGQNGRLIAGILTDEAVEEKKPTPLLPFAERIEIAESIKYIDEVVPQNAYSPIENLYRLKPSIVVESTSHDERDVKEVTDVMSTLNGKVIILPYCSSVSSTKIKQRVKSLVN